MLAWFDLSSVTGIMEHGGGILLTHCMWQRLSGWRKREESRFSHLHCGRGASGLTLYGHYILFCIHVSSVLLSSQQTYMVLWPEPHSSLFSLKFSNFLIVRPGRVRHREGTK